MALLQATEAEGELKQQKMLATRSKALKDISGTFKDVPKRPLFVWQKALARPVLPPNTAG